MRAQFLIWTCLLLPLAGCGSDVVEQAQKTASQVTQSVTKSVNEAATSAQEQLRLAGSAEMLLEEPVKTAACYALFTPPQADMPGVLALRSYKQTEQESFPSLLVQAAVDAEKLAELPGKSLSAQLFIKPAADRPTWHTAMTQPIEIKILAVTDNQITAEIVSGELTTSDGLHSRKAQGKFVAVVP